ncbi:HalOD1 output domain-containing protein [Candidatus Halobonum tyrrellensis]|uniref:Halobacterial output domain-containing protein n=1 Tax=Candidatus Halobonum tyrrellensis G22 TaxID=1324957 RepID=V4HEE6_9EURY|nr:HalOD1 output domain-containing protein [Candidatus Halobonum tyrrellensis]ESP88448.1 hypothetical protein K933_08312 [Candidatus Halobonum tyrrellensis G22]
MDDAGGDGRFLVTDGTRTFETRYDGGRPSVAVVRAIAAVKDVPATDVGFSLHEYVDADALDGLFRGAAPRTADLTVEFPVDGFLVSVRADGRVLVEPTPDDR